MSVFPSWPWTNFHEENLDWVIKKVKYIEEHLEEIVVDATTDMLDDTLTNPDKAAQAKAAGDAIRGNAADIASLDTTVQGITNNVTNLTTRVTRNENSINNLLAADEDLDDRITDLNNMYQGTRTDVINLTSRVSHDETLISGLGSADEALSDRITALEGTVNAVKDYVFNIYEYDGANDPLYICTMEDSPNGINSLLSDLNGRIPVNVKAVISHNGITGSRVVNLTTVRVGNEIHGVEFDAGDFHCRFLDSNTMGTAYFNKVYISVNWTTSTVNLVKGNCDTLKHYTPQITITDLSSGGSYIPIFIDHSHEQEYVKLWFMDQVEQGIQSMDSRYVQVNVDDTAQLT